MDRREALQLLCSRLLFHLRPDNRCEDRPPAYNPCGCATAEVDYVHCYSLFSSPWPAIHPGGGGGQPGPLARLFGEHYESRPPRGVTRRCLPGGMLPRGHRSSDGATGQAGARCQGIRPSCRARATASVRLAAPSLPRMCVTCFLTVSSATTRSWAMRWFDLPAASSRSTSSSRPVSGSARPGGAAARLGGGVAPVWLQAR